METRYSRHTKAQFNQPLTREGLKIFHACRDPLSARELAERTGFPIETVYDRLGTLLEQGVLSVSGAAASTEAPAAKPAAAQLPVTESPWAETPAAPSPATTVSEPFARTTHLETLKRDLLGTLEPKLGRSSADLAALTTAENVAALEQTARRLVVKLKLTVDRKTGAAFERQVAELFGVA